MGHSVSKAADNAVEKSKKVKASDRTPEQVLADIRRNFIAGLAVTPEDQRWLLAQYDALVEKDLEGQVDYMQVRITQLVEENTQLTTKLQEFRDVYEQENRSTVVKVERVLGEPVDCVGIAKTVLGITDGQNA